MVTGVFAVVVLSDSVGAVGAVDCRSCRSCRSAVGVLSDFAVVLSYRGSTPAGPCLVIVLPPFMSFVSSLSGCGTGVLALSFRSVLSSRRRRGVGAGGQVGGKVGGKVGGRVGEMVSRERAGGVGGIGGGGRGGDDGGGGSRGGGDGGMREIGRAHV